MMKTQSYTNKSGFTLVELLVVIAIIAALTAIAFPVISRMIAKSRTTASVSNLKQLHIAAEGYASDHYDIFPATYWGDPDAGVSRVYWWTALGPYLYNSFDIDNQRIDGIFRDKADPNTRAISEDELRRPAWKEISYMPWANGSTDNSRAIRGISTTRTENLSGQPYLSTSRNTGTWACAGESAYNRYVASSAEWRNNQIIVLYCDGAIKVIKDPTFEKVAPAMAEDDN